MKRSFGNRPFRLLDIGAGNHSASKIKGLFPNCEYHGVDLERGYNNDASDFALMAGFYEMDLTQLDMSPIPDDYFDGIWMVHVIEHLHNGDEVIKSLLSKLRKGGYVYVEYPGPRSLRLPRMHGTLHFNDDPTHVRLYTVSELRGLFESMNFRVLKSGTRRSFRMILAMPFRLLACLLTGKKPFGNIFWDILGFAEYVWAKKT